MISLGSRTSCGRIERIGFFRIDAQVADCRRDITRWDQTVLRERMQRGNCNALGIHFEKAPQRLARVAPAIAVRAKHDIALLHPGPDQIRNRFHKIRCGNNGPRSIPQHCDHIRHTRIGFRMQPVPAVGRQRFIPQLLIAGGAPYIGRNLEFFREQLLRLQHAKA